MAKLPANVTRLIVGAVVAAIVLVGAYFVFFSGGSDKTITAQFASATGIYKGTPVKILGVSVGHVTGVHPEGEYVRVTMVYDSKYKLAPNASAIEVANSLVSDRYIQLTPLYDQARDHGKYLNSGAVIPMNRTGGPAELDDIYAALDKLAVALGPQGANAGGKQNGSLSTLLKVASANLKGNGAALGQSITNLSLAARTLADKRDDLFGTVRNLRKFTDALQSSDGQIRRFNEQLAQVASDLASERTDLGAALHDLTIALDEVSNFVKKNAGKFHTDVRGLEDITGVLVKEKSSLNETLALDDVSTFVKQNASRFHTDIRGLEDFTGILVKEKASLTETLAIGPVALANLVHTYQPDIGAIATRSNLASLTSTQNNSPVAILCSVLSLAPIDLSKVCPGDKGGGGLIGGINGGNSESGIGIPGLIGAGS